MSISISEVRADIMARGIMPANKFNVNITVPDYLTGRYDSRTISTRCESASLPGVSMTGAEGMRLGYGPLEMTPSSLIFQDIPLVFMLDARGDVYEFFYNWMNCIVNYNSSRGANAKEGPVSSASTYEVGYKSKFTSQVEISSQGNKQNDANGGYQNSITTTLYSAYPKSISDLDLNWGETDTYVKLQVVLGFKDYKTTFYNG
jgi:hypothetical protein